MLSIASSGTGLQKESGSMTLSLTTTQYISLCSNLLISTLRLGLSTECKHGRKRRRLAKLKTLSYAQQGKIICSIYSF